jgi:two-component system, chemotaxis family, sensor histidine kinase and response regulator PixL
MSLNPDIRDRAYQFFIEEAQELLQVLEDGLLALKEDHSTNKVHDLMRAAHSIKGGAASVELEAIKHLAHRLEDFFKALYSDSVEFDSELESLLLQGYDCLRHPLTQQMETGTYDEEVALLTAEPIFAALEIRLADALKDADNYIPSSNDLGVDIVASIFEVDVVQSLDRLTEVVNNPQNYEIIGELRAQLEVFAGFAELFNLPGFTEIIQTAQTALENYPDRALAILQATIADCTLAKDAVLAGDRGRGGEVSSALLALTQVEVTEDIGTNLTDNLSLNEVFGENTDIWGVSPNPETESLVDDVFGSIADSADSPDDVFGNILDTATEPEIATENALDDVFGNIPDAIESETVETLDNVFGNIPDAIEPETVETLDNVFGNIPDAVESEIATESSLDNVFGNIPDAAESSVDNVFGNLPDAANDSNIDDFAKISHNTPTTDGYIEDLSEIIPESQDELNCDRSVSREDNLPQPAIETTVESIAEIFDRLPAIDSIPASLSFTEAKTTSQPNKAKSTEHSTSPQNKSTNLSVKVELHRLERMNNLIGELTIDHNSLALQNQQLQDNVRELLQKFSRFQEVTKKLREISDIMLIEQRSDNLSTPTIKENSPQQDNLTPATEFDALEMDSYSVLHNALQVVLEEVVQLEEGVDDLAIFAKQSDRTIDIQRQMLGQMRDELMWVRMLPLEQILQRFPRTLRDLSHKYQKPVELYLTGTGVLVDKAVLEKLYDPLLHLLRNGFDHGIESTQARLRQNKPATGRIDINAYYRGNQTIIEIKDDGKGLDLDKIAEKAVSKGLISSQQVATASKEELYNLIFEPGFSTADKVSEISGRGVGMSVVRSQIELLKGKITVESTPGKGSTFSLCLPLTLTITKLLVCSLGSTAFAIASDSIEEIVIPVEKQIRFSGSQKFLTWQRTLVPVYSLKQLLEYNCTIPHRNLNSKAFATVATPDDWGLPLLLVRRGQRLFALEVEHLISEQELVIKPFSKAIATPPYTYGCTILNDGTLVPTFNGAALIDRFVGEDTITPSSISAILPSVEVDSVNLESVEPSLITSVATVESESQLTSTTTSSKLIGSCDRDLKGVRIQTIMVVDDSTAMRRTMSLSLEKQGYRVIQAKDGRDAIDKFRQNSDLNLIICDIEMPTMNGFEFLGMRRRDSELSKIPVVMLTSRSGAKHRTLATQLGANGYFTKPYIEQEFLIEVKKILDAKNSGNKPIAPTKTTVERKTILVIDDSSALRKTLALSLETKNYRVLQARDGVEALELLKNNLHAVLIICDVEMPNMNGFEFLAARRQDTNLTNIPVVMLTSRSTDKHRTLAENLGAKAYFTKPYVEDKFLKEIEQIIKK